MNEMRFDSRARAFFFFSEVASTKVSPGNYIKTMAANDYTMFQYRNPPFWPPRLSEWCKCFHVPCLHKAATLNVTLEFQSPHFGPPPYYIDAVITISPRRLPTSCYDHPSPLKILLITLITFSPNRPRDRPIINKDLSLYLCIVISPIYLVRTSLTPHCDEVPCLSQRDCNQNRL